MDQRDISLQQFYRLNKIVSDDDSGDATVENGVTADLAEMKNKLKLYVERGRVSGAGEAREDPLILVRPDTSMIKPLEHREKSEVISWPWTVPLGL